MSLLTTANLQTWQQALHSIKITQPEFAYFLQKAINSADEQDLADNPQSQIQAALLESFENIGHREAGRPSIRANSRDDGRVTILDIYSTDSPFLVDSIMEAVLATGTTIRFLAHPVLALDRSTTPWRIAPDATPQTHNESILHIHFDTLADENELTALIQDLYETLAQVRNAVTDWRDMLEQLRVIVVAYRDFPPRINEGELTEAMHFLAWLADHNFTFLGMRRYNLVQGAEQSELEPIQGSGLGILKDPQYLFLRKGSAYVEMTEQHRDFLSLPAPIMVTKASRRSRVHHRQYMDYIGIKLYNAEGNISGELRILGLFTSKGNLQSPKDIPVLRRKLQNVLAELNLDPRSHSGKALSYAIETYPRADLFQISTSDLATHASIIATLPDRPRVRVLPRLDYFGNFVSILVYLPKDRFNSNNRAKIGEYLAQYYDGRVSTFTPSFQEGDLVRIHFIIGRDGGMPPRNDRVELEKNIQQLLQSYVEQISAIAPQAISAKILNAFPADYQLAFSPQTALHDIDILTGLNADNPIALALTQNGNEWRLKAYHAQNPLPLSFRVPILENFGFSVTDENTYKISNAEDATYFLHDMTLECSAEHIAKHISVIEHALLETLSGKIENDRYNALTVTAGIVAEDVVILRALGHYLKQIGTAYSQSYIASALLAQNAISTQLIALFHAFHDPEFIGDRDEAAGVISGEIEKSLESVKSIDEDKIIRRFLNLINASLRTNFFQKNNAGEPRSALALKFDGNQIDDLVEPRPFREIFVYSQRVEGVHMRAGAISRGGLRWSDRVEDYRTEVLGLVKAQMVKNAVIVPMGAKGGFVPRQMPASPDRETYMAEGTACYKIFISAMLDVTDNIMSETLTPPENTYRRDGDDPYLVVAADKGTASFSDTANAIALDRDFWLGDAFASGGSAGYDHKKMAITARGGWESVKRHFREIDIDIQTTAFTVAGVGDMSGDVFGNGMLLSPKIKLVAAFDHRDIFLDPNPDCAAAFAERKRLFGIPRSSWQDYNPAILSEGGAIYARNSKSITLSPQSQAMFGLSSPNITPTDLMSLILKANVDLLWFGGIGTYIRGRAETDAQVGDRANDAIRVYGDQVQARTIGEGANLGVTQLGRVEYALRGGKINTDAIDNSGGVNSSDLEVNIKIAISNLTRSGELSADQRQHLLAEMTTDVAELCLRNNYLQGLALSLAQLAAHKDNISFIEFMESLEHLGELNRQIEFLPDNETLSVRYASGNPLTRPELAVLLAYAKNTFYQHLLQTTAIDNPYFNAELLAYFPSKLQSDYADAIEKHQLRREIIATMLTNALVNRAGITIYTRLATITSADAGAIATAFVITRDGYEIEVLYNAIDALDGKISGSLQLDIYAQVQSLVVSQTLWNLRNISSTHDLSDIIKSYRSSVHEIAALAPELVTPTMKSSMEHYKQNLSENGVPADLANKLALLPVLTFAPDITLVAGKTNQSIADATKAFFAVIGKFKLGRITSLADEVTAHEKFDRLALDRALANLHRSMRDLSSDILTHEQGSIADKLEAWENSESHTITRTQTAVSELLEGELTVSKLSVAAGLLADLAKS